MIDSILRHSSPKRAVRRWQAECNDTQFLNLMRELRSYGGMLPVEEVRAVSYVCNPGSNFSQLFLQNMLFFIVWRRQHWMPCFQLCSLTWLPCSSVSMLIQELRPRVGGTELAMWFTQKDTFLGGGSPVELLRSNFEQVRSFARQTPFTPLGNMGQLRAHGDMELSDGRSMISCHRSMS